LIQGTCAVGNSGVHISVDRLQNGQRHHVHRYSRVVYFKSYIMSIQGRTEPSITNEVLNDLRATLNGARSISPKTVSKALLTLNIANRYRRHRYTITHILNPNYPKLTINDYHTVDILKLFRRIEIYWDTEFKKTLRKRKAFLSYPYIFFQICQHLNFKQYTGPHHLLKDVNLLKQQHHLYMQIADKLKLICDVNTLNVERF